MTTANESKLGGARGGHRGPIILRVAAARVLPLLPVAARGARLVLSMGLAAGCVRARSSSSPLRGGQWCVRRATSLPSNDHKTGKGHVKFKKGEYHDALTVKRNEVCLLLHENLGGGFSPPAAHKIRRLGRKARSGIDRTPYKTDRKISFVSYHTRSISMNITRAEAWQLHKAVNTAKGDLCRHRDRNPTGGA